MKSLSFSEFQRSLVSVLGAVLLALGCVGAATGPAAAHDVPVITA